MPRPTRSMYEQSVADATVILADHDPADLIGHGAPGTEYESEARELVRRSCRNPAQGLEAIVREVLYEHLQLQVSQSEAEAVAADLRASISVFSC